MEPTAAKQDLNWRRLWRFFGAGAAAAFAVLVLAWAGASWVTGRATREAVDQAEATVAEVRQRVIPARAAGQPRAPARAPASEASVSRLRESAAAAGWPLDMSPAEIKARDESMFVSSQQAWQWLSQQMRHPKETIDPAPAAVRALMEPQRPALDGLEQALLAGDAGALAILSEHPYQSERLIQDLLVDALLQQLDGNAGAAASRTQAAWALAQAWVEQSSFIGSDADRYLVQALVVARKTPVPATWATRLDMTALRADSAEGVAARAEGLASLARQGTAGDVLAKWNKEPTWLRRLMLPAYRRRLAETSGLVADRAVAMKRLDWQGPGLLADTVPRFTAPPLEGLPRPLRELAVGTGYEDLVEPRWYSAWTDDAYAGTELDRILIEWELTRRVLILREQRDANPDGAWPSSLGDLAASDVPGLSFSAEVPVPGGILIRACGLPPQVSSPHCLDLRLFEGVPRAP